MKISTPQSASVTSPGNMRDIIQIASPSIMKPKAFFTATIHGPAFGRNFPCATPTTNNGAPIPRLIANSAVPPRSISPVCAMTVKVATRAGATQAVTMSDDRAPMTNAPTVVPLFWPPLIAATRDWIAAGICRSNMPNMASASTTNSPENRINTGGWLKMACSCNPAAAAATPAAVYTRAMPRT